MFWKKQRKEGFTPEAKQFWESLSEINRERILQSAYCRKCGGSVTIVDFSGELDDLGDLILEGKCRTCGGNVARLVENE